MLFSKPGQTGLEQFFSANCLRIGDSGELSKVIHDHLFLHNNLQTGIPKLLYSTRLSGLLKRHRCIFSYIPAGVYQARDYLLVKVEFLLAKIVRSSSKVSVIQHC
jgi:hypothetical protein